MIRFTEFFNDEAGAVSLDWMTITAGILLLGIIVVYAIANGGLSELVPTYNDSFSGTPAEVVVGTIVVE